jgi:hypothetical protein
MPLRSAGQSGPHDSVQPQSGSWAMTGKEPVARREARRLQVATIGRMDAIGHSQAMAGSPDADFAIDAKRLAVLRMAFVFSAPRFS